MDLTQLASAPSNPNWEVPRFHSTHTITIRFCSTNNAKSQYKGSSDLSERAKDLDRISLEFQALVGSGAPLDEVELFIKRWEVNSSSGTPIVQPNVLAWFNDTNALRLACANDNADVVRFLLQKGLLVSPSAITFAISKLRDTKDTTVLELLLDFGWDINKPISETAPPLIFSVVDIPDLVHWCLSRGADPGLSSPSGLFIIEHAASFASVDIMRVLIERAGARSRDVDSVARASYSHALGTTPNRVEVARFLLDQGYPIDAFYKTRKPSASGGDGCEDLVIGSQNALHFAIWSGKEDMVKLLLERGADRMLPTRSLKTEGKTLSPLELASKLGHSTIVALLQDVD